MLTAISPIDGRYSNKTKELTDFFSEFSLIKYRIHVEVQYFIALCEIPLPPLKDVPKEQLEAMLSIVDRFNIQQAERIKAIESETNHDVKAVEYFLKEKMEEMGYQPYKEFIHFGLTSQDINNTAIPLQLKDALPNIYHPHLHLIVAQLEELAESWQDIPMLARTHGQPASPTRLGKEIEVFLSRLEEQVKLLNTIPLKGKFGGATGNFNAHYTAYPDIDWHGFGTRFVTQKLGLERAFPTTQIEHYDNLAALFQGMKRINTILIDLCRDIWTYISMDYFKQQLVAGEVGSSAMPHKVNPIDFENAEGNLGMANAIFTHLADKLPVSRLQRDLTDSTVTRNIGVPFGHTIIAFKSIHKGLRKIIVHPERIDEDLNQNWMVVSEAIQTVLRREGYPKPYEALKALTRGNPTINQEGIHAFIDQLNIPDAIKEELKKITPQNYIGR